MTLIERICAAEAGSRELDAEIAVALRCGLPSGCNWANNFPKWEADPVEKGLVRIIGNHNGNCDDISGRFTAPRYTTSVDSALSLVPEGSEWVFDSHHTIARVFAYPMGPNGPECDEYKAEASTPALAICAAAIQARSA